LIRKRIYLLNKELLHWDNFYMKLLPEQKNALVPYLNRWENRYNFLRFASHEPITDEILLELKQIQYDAGIYLSDNFRSKRNSVG